MSGSSFGDVQDALTSAGSTLSKADQDTQVRELTALVNQVRTEFKDRNLLHAYIDDILFRRIPVAIPEAFKKTTIQVHSPLPGRIANAITAALSINPPSVQFQPIGFGQSFEENATMREHFFDASWERQQEEAKLRLFRKFMYSLVTKGEAVLKTVERAKTAWSTYATFSKALTTEQSEPDGPYAELSQDEKDQVYHARTEEYKRGQPYPIRTSFVSAQDFLYVKGEEGFTFCAEVKDVPYTETLERFGYALDSRARVVPQGIGLPSHAWSGVMSKHKTLRLLEIWTWKTAFYVLIGPGQTSSGASGEGKLAVGTLVKKLNHGYGDRIAKTLRGPYFHAFGVTTDSNLPDRAGLSILYDYLELFPLLDSMLTIRGNAAYWAGFPAYKRTVAPGATLPPSPYGRDGSEADGATTQIVPGSIYPYDVEPIQHPAAGPEFNAFIGELRAMLESAFPPAAQGTAGGDQSGYAANQANYNSRLAWDPLIDNAEIALGERVGFESWLIENRIKEKVYVWGEAAPDLKRKGAKDGWLGMDGEITRGVHRYKVVLNPMTPSNKIIDVRTHQEMLQLRLESREDAITELGGNPDEVERSWLLNDMKQDPAIQSALRNRAFEELASIDRKALGGTAAMSQAQQDEAQTPPNVGLGGTMANLGQVFQPGQGGQPLAPSPAGSAGGAPGATAGAPGGIQGPPQNAQPLAGQGPTSG